VTPETLAHFNKRDAKKKTFILKW